MNLAMAFLVSLGLLATFGSTNVAATPIANNTRSWIGTWNLKAKPLERYVETNASSHGNETSRASFLTISPTGTPSRLYVDIYDDNHNGTTGAVSFQYPMGQSEPNHTVEFRLSELVDPFKAFLVDRKPTLSSARYTSLQFEDPAEQRLTLLVIVERPDASPPTVTKLVLEVDRTTGELVATNIINGAGYRAWYQRDAGQA